MCASLAQTIPSAALLVGVLMLGVAGHGAEEPEEAGRTMFWPPDFHGHVSPVVAVANPLDRFEFCGVLTVAGTTFITLVDGTTQRSLLATLGETLADVTVAEFQSEASSVVLTSGALRKRLTLREPRIVAATAPAPMIPIRRPAPIGAPIVIDGATSPPDFGAEIRRRREIRRQMLEVQSPQPAPTNLQ